MEVYVNDKPVQVLPGMTVKHALVREGLLRELERDKRFYDEWGNELGLDGALCGGRESFIRCTSIDNNCNVFTLGKPCRLTLPDDLLECVMASLFGLILLHLDEQYFQGVAIVQKPHEQVLDEAGCEKPLFVEHENGVQIARAFIFSLS